MFIIANQQQNTTSIVNTSIVNNCIYQSFAEQLGKTNLIFNLIFPNKTTFVVNRPFL
jgi:hypothetical protein